MLFNSFSFMLFFPLVVTLYFLIPHRFRYLWLLVTSYYFYMCWNPKYAVLIATSTVITYFSGLLIQRENDAGQAGGRAEARAESRKKLWVAASFGANLSILFFFKYFNFALQSVSDMLANVGIQFVSPTFDVVLPVGISFYTFQALSYTMDVYRKDIYVERNLLKYALFVSFFPQLVAGPIERSKNLLIQINERHYFDYERVKKGLLLMLWGLFLKLVIADRVALLVNQVFNNYTWYIGIQIAVAAVFFALQIYCDFGSYSIIAKGSALVMGFRLMDNFQQPYFATSIGEFWHRWHISLSTWFRDYLYIPLGGNRKGKVRKYINVMIVFLCSGLWHGADWSFVMWGFLHGIYQVIGEIIRPAKMMVTDRLGIRRDSFSYRLGQGLITFILVDFAWIFFRANDMEHAYGVLGQMFAKWNPICLVDGTMWELGLSRANFGILLIAVFCLLMISILEYRGHDIWQFVLNQGFLFRWCIYLLLMFSIIIFGIYGPGYSESQFIYFQF